MIYAVAKATSSSSGDKSSLLSIPRKWFGVALVAVPSFGERRREVKASAHDKTAIACSRLLINVAKAMVTSAKSPTISRLFP